MRILTLVESYGGGYVWESELFTVSLVDVAIQDEAAACLLGLTGVEQIALNASHLQFATILKLATIAELQSLVLFGTCLSEPQRALLDKLGSRVQVIADGLVE